MPEQSRISTRDRIDSIDSLVHTVDKSVRRRRKQLLGAQAAMLATITLTGSYWSDVEANKELQSNSAASVTVYSEPDIHTDEARSAQIYFNGFGTYDADAIAETFSDGISAAFPNGESWSVSYGNAPLDSQHLAAQITNLARERNVTTVDIIGYSAGGVIGIDTAAELSELTDIHIRSIVTVSTPDGIEGLRPYQRQELDLANTLASLPGAQYSTAVRFAGELYFMRDRFDSGNLWERVTGIGKAASLAFERLQGPKSPGTWLLVDQTLAIAEMDIETNMQRIAENYADTHPSPTLLYVGTAAPGRDYMVDNTVSSQRICSYAHAHTMNCLVYNVPGAVHTMPEKTADAYTQTFTEASIPLNNHVTASFKHFINTKIEKSHKVMEDPPESSSRQETIG